MASKKLFHLPERSLIKISGDDAESFLQNLVTQDMTGLAAGKLIYSCLLTAQGRFLHDFFIHKQDDAYLLECETARREDLQRRLKIFKLRSKVVIEDCAEQFKVYAGEEGQFQDPRLLQLGYRSYVSSRQDPLATLGMTEIVGSAQEYKDHRLSLGIPEGSIDIKPEIDTLADANLDKLHAVSWTKGCFIGQEVAARMENRALVKKRMVIVSGQQLAAGDALSQNGVSVGEVRSVNTNGMQGLALLKLAALAEKTSPFTRTDGDIISASLPSWLRLDNT